MLYNGGLDRLADIETAGYSWILLKDTGYLFDRADQFIADLVPATNEVTVDGYDRVLLTAGDRTVNNGSARVEYRATAPNFGSLTLGENVTAIVLAQNASNDADSPLVGFYNFASIDAGDMDPFIISFADNLLAWADEA